jgi:hypothetical protein
MFAILYALGMFVVERPAIQPPQASPQCRFHTAIMLVAVALGKPI